MARKEYYMSMFNHKNGTRIISRLAANEIPKKPNDAPVFYSGSDAIEYLSIVPDVYKLVLVSEEV